MFQARRNGACAEFVLKRVLKVSPALKNRALRAPSDPTQVGPIVVCLP
jgi:hypothetical protein